MARGVFSTSNYFKYAGSSLAATPLTLAAWVNPGDLTAYSIPIALYYTSGANAEMDGWLLRITQTTGALIAFAADGTGTTGATGPAALTASIWTHVGGVFASSTSRYAYVNGAIGTQSTTSRTPTAPDKIAVGVRIYQSGTVGLGSTQLIVAEIGIWNVVLTDAEMLQLAAGYSPLFVRPESLFAYYPLIRGDANGDEPESMGGLNMVEQGTVAVAAHCPVRYPTRPRVITFTSALKARLMMDHYRRLRV